MSNKISQLNVCAQCIWNVCEHIVDLSVDIRIIMQHDYFGSMGKS